MASAAGHRQALGLIAGLGTLPLDVARFARERGRRVVAVAFHGHTDAHIESAASEVTWLHPGEVGAALAALRSGGVCDAVMAGKVPKATLLGDPAALRLDARAIELLGRLRDRRDDSILGAIADFMQGEGIRLLSQTDAVPELTAGVGPLGRQRATPEQLADVAFGWPIVRQVAGLDIGQTVVVKQGAVLAVEAIEGTDAAIRRGGAVVSGGVVLKVAKPTQDPRFDVPTIGPGTVQALIDARAHVLAFEAHATLVLERKRLVELADAHDIAVIGVPVAGPGSEDSIAESAIAEIAIAEAGE